MYCFGIQREENESIILYMGCYIWEEKKMSIYNKVKCEECRKEFYKITNTHLWAVHRMTTSEYEAKHPTAKLEDEKLSQDRVAHLRGKTYEEIYGGDGANYQKLKQKENILESRYREIGLAYHGEFCDRCGVSDNLIIHHIDTNRKNNVIDNLQVLCKKCHNRLHKNIPIHKFTGIKLVEQGMQLMLKGLENEFGLDIKDPNFDGTPQRVARAYYEIFEGINCDKDLCEIANTSFPSEYEGMVVVKNIQVFSMCPHHFLPVEYQVNVGYIPDKKTVGLSKLARIVEILAKRPELQEMFTENISKILTTELSPKGVIVQVKGRHMCMVMRGVKKDSWTLTSSVTGPFRDDDKTRAEFMSQIQ